MQQYTPMPWYGFKDRIRALELEAGFRIRHRVCRDKVKVRAF